MRRGWTNERRGRFIAWMTVALLAGVVTMTVVSCVRGTGECPPGQTLVRTKTHRMEQWECRTL